MGDHTELAAGTSRDPGILPSTSTSEDHASEPSPDDNAEHLECAVDPYDIHVEEATVVAPKHAIFTCNECALSFSSKRLYMQHHKRAHNVDIPNVMWCLYCDYCTSNESNCNRHTLAHTEGKRHPCEECQKTFRHLEHLVTHRETHTKEKKFLCSTCNKSFSRRSNLFRHERSKHSGKNANPKACELCGRCFYRADNLARHQVVHTGERRFSCEKCHKNYRHLTTLKRHIKKFHP